MAVLVICFRSQREDARFKVVERTPMTRGHPL